MTEKSVSRCASGFRGGRASGEVALGDDMPQLKAVALAEGVVDLFLLIFIFSGRMF